MANKRHERLSAIVSMGDMPEILADLRREMATLLRREAATQEENVIGWAVRQSLQAVADAFEAGLIEMPRKESDA